MCGELSALASNAACKLNVLWHDGHTFSMDGTKVGVLEKANKVSFSCFLESTDSGRLEAKVGLELLSNFADKALERQLANQQFG